MTTTDLVRLFWGKAGPKEKGTTELHPALFHMLDVGMVARAMVERSLQTALRGLRFARDLPADEASRRIGFLIALHDLGKISPGFQGRRRDLTREQQTRGFRFPEGAEPDHSHVTLQPLRFRADRNRAAVALARAIATHHGAFHPKSAARQRLKDGTGLWWDAREATIDALSSVFHVDREVVLRPTEFPSADGMVLAGLTSVGDWIGSSKELFPPKGPRPRTLEDYAREAYSRAHAALGRVERDPWLPDGAVWDFSVPTHLGVDRTRWPASAPRAQCPYACGGGPVIRSRHSPADIMSPRMRGRTAPRTSPPAEAEMSPRVCGRLGIETRGRGRRSAPLPGRLQRLIGTARDSSGSERLCGLATQRSSRSLGRL